MKYQVTFYKNSMEMLTERKANFVNQLKKLTTLAIKALADKIQTKGETTGHTIYNFMKDMMRQGSKKRNVIVYVSDFSNIKLEGLPNTGQPIPFEFTFINKGENPSWDDFDTSGVCTHRFMKNRAGEIVAHLIDSISCKIEFSLRLDKPNPYGPSTLLKEIQSTIVHEIAHAKDELYKSEYQNYSDKSRTSDEDIRYINYWIKPTEIRSHMNEMIRIVSRNRLDLNQKRLAKNRYKERMTSHDAGYEFTEEDKQKHKTIYSMMKKSHESKQIDEFSKDALLTVLNRAFRGKCQKLLKNFIFDYHVSFVRDSNPKMKERYYDPYFPNTDVPSFDTMQEFYEAIKNVTRGFTKLKSDIIKDVQKSVRIYGGQTDEDKRMVNEFNDMYVNLWIRDDLSAPFQNYNSKLLKKLGKQMIENFREKHNLMTKGMLTKQAKALTRELNKKHKTDTSGMEDFFNSDPNFR